MFIGWQCEVGNNRKLSLLTFVGHVDWDDQIGGIDQNLGRGILFKYFKVASATCTFQKLSLHNVPPPAGKTKDFHPFLSPIQLSVPPIHLTNPPSGVISVLQQGGGRWKWKPGWIPQYNGFPQNTSIN